MIHSRCQLSAYQPTHIFTANPTYVYNFNIIRAWIIFNSYYLIYAYLFIIEYFTDTCLSITAYHIYNGVQQRSPTSGYFHTTRPINPYKIEFYDRSTTFINEENKAIQ